MPRLRAKPEIKAILLTKEILLYEALQSRMAYAVPLFLVLIGTALCFPFTWELLAARPKLAAIYPHAYHLLYELHYALVFVAFGLGLLLRRLRSAKKNQHFVTNLRVVEHSKTLLHDDVQYIMLHHIKLVRIKANPLQMLTFTGKMILEDDLGYEHIEIPDVSSPRDFKRAILSAKKRFDEAAMRAEKDGVLKQTQSAKTKREKNKKKRLEARKQEQLQHKQEQEQQKRMHDGGGY